MDRFSCRGDRFVCGAGLLRRRDLPAGAAGSRAGRHDRGPGAVHRPGHPRRPERLAVDGRPGGGQRLGTRGLRRARLVGRLAASRGRMDSQPLVSRRARAAVWPARRGAGGGIEGQARRGTPHKHV